MIITLEVSAAVEFIMGRKNQLSIKSKLEKADWIIAPTLFIYETSAVIWKYHSFKNYPQDKLLRKLLQILNLID